MTGFVMRIGLGTRPTRLLIEKGIVVPVRCENRGVFTAKDEKLTRWGRNRAATISFPIRSSAEAEDAALPRPEAVPVGARVLVAGATGGVGQLVVQRLLDSGFTVRAVARDVEKAKALLGSTTPNLEIVECDMRNNKEIPPIMADVDAVCSCIGTTAFPSSRWKGDNSPKQTDEVAIGNLIKNTPSSVHRFVLVSSAGVKRTKQFPFVVLNLFDVLTYRRMAEETVMASELPWTILRPSRLTDAPYTSFDLNTLIKGTRGSRLGVKMSLDDDLYGEASRISVAEAIVQCLHLPQTTYHCYAMESIEGENPPGEDTNKWSHLFATC